MIEQEKIEKEKKELNPDYDTLFGDDFGTEKKEEVQEEEKDGNNSTKEIEIDPRNSEVGVGFIDCMGYKIRVKEGDYKTNPW